MDTRRGIAVHNWKRTIRSFPQVVVEPTCVDDIIAALTGSEDDYPSPVRAVGSNHSTTRCGVANGGTLLDMSKMNRILSVDADAMTVTAQSGAIYIDVAEELEKHGLQFYVNVELGNLSIGSAACGGTKDASMPGEFGQVCSYAVAMKMVLPSGELLCVDESQPELLRIMRSSYGLLGVLYEVTFKVKKLEPMAVEHVTYSLDEFTARLPELAARGKSMMLFLTPFLDRVTVEYRTANPDGNLGNRWAWRVRNYVWKTLAPTYGFVMTKVMPIKPVRYFFIDRFNRSIQWLIARLVRSRNTVPTDQQIRYPHRAGWSAYTFSIWAFPEAEYPRILREYYQFCRDYYAEHGYRCNMVNVGYRISGDDSSLFSYSTHGTVLTLDPVSTGDPGWPEFIQAYNEFCSERGGVPLFNQTRGITPTQARRAFGDQLDLFERYRRDHDPNERLLNDYFRRILHQDADIVEIAPTAEPDADADADANAKGAAAPPIEAAS